jgi:hypothetical protein
MIHRFHWLKGGAAVLVVAAATITPTTGSAATAVYVANVGELYDAVNNSANVGASVILAPGIYVLSSTRPHSGRLELLEDMSLYGVAGDRAAVVIDATKLPPSSFTDEMPVNQRTGVIRTGRGRNVVEWLTIAGHPRAAAAVETDLPTPQAQVRVAHVVAGNSSRGVDIRTLGAFGPDMIGRRIDAEIVDGEFFGGLEGIRVANFPGADEGDIRVVMSGNHSYDNRLGCILENNRTSHATIYVRSSGDLFDGNGLGCQIGGALVTMPGFANSNSTVFEGHGTQFINNNKRTDFCEPCMGPVIADFGGVLVVGGDVLPKDLVNAASGNTVTVRLWGCQVAENQTFPGIDFQAFGAFSASASEIAGTLNHATIELHGVSAGVDVVAMDSSPVDPSGSNTVTIFRSPSAP